MNNVLYIPVLLITIVSPTWACGCPVTACMRLTDPNEKCSCCVYKIVGKRSGPFVIQDSPLVQYYYPTEISRIQEQDASLNRDIKEAKRYFQTKQFESHPRNIFRNQESHYSHGIQTSPEDDGNSNFQNPNREEMQSRMVMNNDMDWLHRVRIMFQGIFDWMKNELNEFGRADDIIENTNMNTE